MGGLGVGMEEMAVITQGLGNVSAGSAIAVGELRWQGFLYITYALRIFWEVRFSWCAIVIGFD